MCVRASAEQTGKLAGTDLREVRVAERFFVPPEETCEVAGWSVRRKSEPAFLALPRYRRGLPPSCLLLCACSYPRVTGYGVTLGDDEPIHVVFL